MSDNLFMQDRHENEVFRFFNLHSCISNQIHLDSSNTEHFIQPNSVDSKTIFWPNASGFLLAEFLLQPVTKCGL